MEAAEKNNKDAHGMIPADFAVLPPQNSPSDRDRKLWSIFEHEKMGYPLVNKHSY